MVDTVILRVLNLSKYPKLYAQYYAPTKKKNTTTMAVTDYDTGEIKEMAKVSSYIYHDTDRILPVVHRSSLTLPSSHYTVSYSLNLAANYLEFNFSLPKYVFATNIFQFINMFDQSVSATFNHFRLFIFKFVKEYFIEQPLYDDLEINRIDLCYNQFFSSKNDCLQYLDEQKKLLTKYARSSKNNFQSRDTSLMYITKRYSFKIYHKGTEFAVNDYKELVKSGGKGLPPGLRDYHLTHQMTGLEFLQSQADNILRYEMTFRRSMLNYLANHYFFASEKAMLYPEYSNHVLSQTSKSLLVFGGKELYEKYRKKHKKFTIRSVFDATKDFFILFQADTITFDETIFYILHKTFFKKVSQYQLTTILSPGEVLKRIDEKNADIKIKNKLRRDKEHTKHSWRLVSAALLQQVMNIDELRPLMPQNSFYRLKRDLAAIGIKQGDTSLTIPQPRVDYFDYRLHFSNFHQTS